MSRVSVDQHGSKEVGQIRGPVNFFLTLARRVSRKFRLFGAQRGAFSDVEGVSARDDVNNGGNKTRDSKRSEIERRRANLQPRL